jgi:cell migration-inducing and hyaluronan-binding protein
MSDANSRHQGNAIGRVAAINLKQWLSSKTTRPGSPASIVIKSVRLFAGLVFVWLLMFGTSMAHAVTCSRGSLVAQPLLSGEPQPDLLVTDGECRVPPGDYYYGNVNIIKNGRLIFEEQGSNKTDFWASSIVVEAGGYLYAGAYNFDKPYGTSGGVLTIYLYGKDQSDGDPVNSPGQGALCRSEENDSYGPCGIPKRLWDDNGKTPGGLVYGIDDYFYQYGPLHGDDKCNDGSTWTADKKCKTADGKVGYFGYKTLAVSYGGGVFMRGYKGAIYDKDPSLLINHPEASVDADHLSSGTSWMRLADGHSLKGGDDTLTLEEAPGNKWQKGDQIVVTTTDYLPGHSEELKIEEIDGKTIKFSPRIKWPHNGVRYGGPNDKSGAANDPTKNQWTRRLDDRVKSSLDPDLVKNGAETRAAVALLTRSIRIVSAGDRAGQTFEQASEDPNNCQKTKAARGNCYSFGGTTVVRQGFAFYRMQGVELSQMGQGGRLGHYPVHFHMARQTPANTYVKDSSINESMTRWIVLHSTLGVTVARNVGYKSIGHGFYLESGTETDNKFYSNIGIFARAAVANVNRETQQNIANPQNPRMVAGILADNTDPASFKSPNLPNIPFISRSDVENPSVFWITNGWNDFIGNMAAGAGTCGAAYWFVPAANSDMVDVPTTHERMNTHEHMKWSGYAGLQMPGMDENRQLTAGLAGVTPLKSFFKNYATSTMHSFQTTPDVPACNGVIAANASPGNFPVLRAVPSLAPKAARHGVPFKNPDHEEEDKLNDHYYPHLVGARQPMRCTPSNDGYDCSKVTEVCRHPPQENCAVTVLDHFTSSFHWAHGNVSAIWLRPQWYLLTNSVLSDVQNGGLTLITGGDYTHSSVIDGYWGLAKSSVFIGNTQDSATNPYASNTGPFNALTKLQLQCDPLKENQLPDYCLNANETISMPTSGFFTNQRLANIYDGPSYQESNAYLDIKTAECPQGGYNSGCMYGTQLSYLRLKREPGKAGSSCYLPNAAIAWKQPNGFFYPPAFHTKNLFFDNVDLRHYVIDPLFKGGTYLTDPVAVETQYCVEKDRYPTFFDSFTSIDRQTELNDDDGTLTGLSNSAPEGPLKQTISINEDAFFSAPRETAECGSALGGNADPKNACNPPAANKPPVTARTSPFDYVATMLYHRQASAVEDKDVWGVECTNQSCYGVPLYRQYLTKAEEKRWTDNKCSDQAKALKPECRWPFIRMSGEALSQRETLTINNGTYYIDTSVSLETQENENYTTSAKRAARSRNVFKGGQTYYVFFAYAKTSTVQTYQIYVGKDFNVATGFKSGRIDIDNFSFLPKSTVNTETWAKPVKSDDGILTVKIDFTGWTALDPSEDSGLCQPRTFCTLEADPKDPRKRACVSALKADDPLIAANRNFAAQNDKICQSWAVKDLDCPAVVRTQGKWTDGGCFAFAFTLPITNFTPDDTYHRPEPKPFPTALDPNKKQGQPDWATKFTPGVKSPDACFYSKMPGTDCFMP